MMHVSGAGRSSAASGDMQLIAIPPPGCDPDAIKLYIGNLPLTSTEADLIPLLSPFGKVGVVRRCDALFRNPVMVAPIRILHTVDYPC